MVGRTPRRRLALTILAALVVWGGEGCGAPRVAAPADAVTEAPALLAAMQARLERAQTARIRADVEVFADQGRAKGRQILLVGAPNRFRIETLSPMDTTLSVVACDGQTLYVYDVEGGHYARGAPTAQNLARVARLPLEPEDVVRMLFGGAPLQPPAGAAAAWTLSWDEAQGAYKLAQLQGGTGTELWIRHGDWGTAAARGRESGTVQFELRTADARDVDEGSGSFMIARRLEVLLHRGDVDLSIDVTRYDLNPPLADALFRIEPPRGMIVESLD